MFLMLNKVLQNKVFHYHLPEGDKKYHVQESYLLQEPLYTQKILVLVQTHQYIQVTDKWHTITQLHHCRL